MSIAFLYFLIGLCYDECRMVAQTLKCVIFHVNILQEKFQCDVCYFWGVLLTPQKRHVKIEINNSAILGFLYYSTGNNFVKKAMKFFLNCKGKQGIFEITLQAFIDTFFHLNYVSWNKSFFKEHWFKLKCFGENNL